MQSSRVSSDLAGKWIQNIPQFDVFGLRRRPCDIKRCANHIRRIHRLHFEPELTADDASCIQEIFDQLQLGFTVSLDHVQAFPVDLLLFWRALAYTNELKPGQNRMKWRAQLMREDCHKTSFGFGCSFRFVQDPAVHLVEVPQLTATKADERGGGH